MEKLAAGCEAGAEKAEVVSGSASLARLSSSYSRAVIFICNGQCLSKPCTQPCKSPTTSMMLTSAHFELDECRLCISPNVVHS